MALDFGQRGLPIALKTFHLGHLSERVGRSRFLEEGCAWLELGKHAHIAEANAIDREEGRGEEFIAVGLNSAEQIKPNASLREWIRVGGMAW